MDLCFPTGARWKGAPDPVDPDHPTDDEATALEQAYLAEGMAWSALQILNAYQLGICSRTIRPCRKACMQSTMSELYGLPFQPYMQPDGTWANMWCSHRSGCDCSAVSEVILPGVVGRVDEVIVNGVVLDPATYRIDNGNHLVRLDGEQWPLCQDMLAPTTETNTFAVTYLVGAAPDDLDFYAAGVLAEEFWKAVTGAKGCRLSKNVTAITRLGVSYEMNPGLFANGLSGIDEVDMIIARRNPYKLKTPTMVMSPDSLRAQGRATTFGG